MGFKQCDYNVKEIAKKLNVGVDELTEAMRSSAIGGFATVWKVEDKGRYAQAQISTSRKNKDTGEYFSDFSGYAIMGGRAYEKAKKLDTSPRSGARIRVTECSVTNKYDKEKKITYTNIAIFDFDPMDKSQARKSSGSTKKSAGKSDDGFLNIPDGVEENLPFV